MVMEDLVFAMVCETKRCPIYTSPGSQAPGLFSDNGIVNFAFKSETAYEDKKA
jgi:hypothetical protein